MRSCGRYREALSARLDGEDPGIAEARIDAHLATCVECSSWVAAAGGLSGGLGGEGEPALRPAALAELLDRSSSRISLPRPLGWWRAGLAVLGALQLVVAWPGALLDDGHAPAHVAHELTSWDLGLAVGFLLVAWLPSRAWGALPVIAVMVAFLAGVSVTDLLSGHAELAREMVHALQVAGLACVWVIARRVPRTSVVLRLASS